jgi:hypothetical protein
MYHTTNLYGLQPPRLARFTPPGPSQKSVELGRYKGKNIQHCLLTNHRPPKSASDKNKNTTTSVSHRYSPDIRQAHPTEPNTYIAHECTRHTPHRIHKLHKIRNEHTINHHISRKISTGKNQHTGHHTVLLNHKRTPHQRRIPYTQAGK